MLKSWMALLGAALPGIAMAADDVTVLHAEPLFAYSVAARSAATEPLAKAAAATTTTTVSFNAFGRDFTLELEPNARLAQIEAELALPLGVGAFRGKLTDRPSSWARAVLTPGGLAGLVFDGSEMY